MKTVSFCSFILQKERLFHKDDGMTRIKEIMIRDPEF